MVSCTLSSARFRRSSSRAFVIATGTTIVNFLSIIEYPDNLMMLSIYKIGVSHKRNKRYYSGFNLSEWWREKRRRLYAERGRRCEGCAEPMDLQELSLHHIVPRSKSGRDVDANLILLCYRCHEVSDEDALSRPASEDTGA